MKSRREENATATMLTKTHLRGAARLHSHSSKRARTATTRISLEKLQWSHLFHSTWCYVAHRGPWLKIQNPMHFKSAAESRVHFQNCWSSRNNVRITTWWSGIQWNKMCLNPFACDQVSDLPDVQSAIADSTSTTYTWPQTTRTRQVGNLKLLERGNPKNKGMRYDF